MKLTNVRVINFRSIQDSGDVPVDQVACLVGKNESGKTNFLQALVRVNPAPGQPAAFDINDDYPRQHLGDIEHDLRRDEFQHPVVVRAIYQLDQNEIKRLADEFGDGTVQLTNGDTVCVSVNYARHRTVEVQVDEALAVKHLAAQAGLSISGTCKTFVELTATTSEDDACAAGVASVTETINSWRDGKLINVVIDRILTWEPMFVYYDEYAQMAGEGNVRELLTKRQNEGALTDAEKTFVALIDLSRIDLDALGAHDYNALRNRLESASIRISKELYTYWSQNQNSGIDFDHTYEQRDGSPPGRGDLILKVRVRDKRHDVSVPIDRRSNGFVWFFSFLVNFSRIRDQFSNRPLVLLLDEPGTALHGLAQQDFLKVLDGPLAEHQVLYTTHQPFLVDPDRLDRARPVVETETEGTKVYPHAYKIDKDTLFPLQAALGYEIGQTLFVAPNVLLVEGTSDLIYLQLLSVACERKKKVGLDRRWTITPVGGVDKMDTFVRLFRGQQLNICALIDATGNKLTKVEKLVRDGDLTAEQVVKLADFVDANTADIEDLMSESFYLDLVRGAGADDPRYAIYGAINAAALPSAEDEPRITRRIDQVLNSYKHPRLDHLAAALYFERHRTDLLDKVDADALKRSEALFAALNAQLRA